MESETMLKACPREPTEEMIEAAAATSGMKACSAAMVLHQARGYSFDLGAFEAGSPLHQAWQAMFDAAPDTRTEPSTITEEGLVERLTKVIDDCHDWQATPREIAERVIAASGHTALLSQIGVLREALVNAKCALEDWEREARCNGEQAAWIDDPYKRGLDEIKRTDAALSRPLP